MPTHVCKSYVLPPLQLRKSLVMIPWLTWNSLHNPDQPHTHGSPAASTPIMLGLQVYTAYLAPISFFNCISQTGKPFQNLWLSPWHHLFMNDLVTFLSLQLKLQASLLEMPCKLGPPLFFKRLSHFMILCSNHCSHYSDHYFARSQPVLL